MLETFFFVGFGSLVAFYTGKPVGVSLLECKDCLTEGDRSGIAVNAFVALFLGALSCYLGLMAVHAAQQGFYLPGICAWLAPTPGFLGAASSIHFFKKISSKSGSNTGSSSS